MWVGLDAPDALRPPIDWVDRSHHRSRVVIKPRWRRLDANTDGFDLE